MRHKKKGRSLNRTRSHRNWLLSNLITSLFHHERIRTTTAKAKEARPLAEKLITFAKRGDLHARRRVLKIVRDKDVVAKLFTSLSDRFKDRPGGYTRIIRMGYRNGDNAPMAMFELMPEEVVKKSGGKKRRSRRPKKKAEAAEQPPVEQAAAEEAAAEAAAVEEAQAAGEQAPVEAPAAEEEPSAGEPELSGGEPPEEEQKKED
ncbi:MAG: 50S ribosomal protein L17 [Candidatus Glassbacteria bacterium]|nr:50S ribosomal protein L17 [Candidatus Glassbacteria bacterium]